MGAIKAAIGDGLITFLWVFCASALGIVTSLISDYIGLTQSQWLATLCITAVLIFFLLFVFGIIGDALGGATFNPTATAAFYAAGVGGSDLSLFSSALRFPAQAIGATAGALGIMEVMPQQYKHMLEGPSLKVDVHTGAIAEGVLTFVITLLVLIIMVRGPNSIIVKNWMLSVVTVVMVVAGAGFTGPSMNPANAYGWAYMSDKHHTWEQLYVYWITPFIGAILAAWTFRAVFAAAPSPAAKAAKTAKKKKKS